MERAARNGDAMVAKAVMLTVRSMKLTRYLVVRHDDLDLQAGMNTPTSFGHCVRMATACNNNFTVFKQRHVYMSLYTLR